MNELEWVEKARGYIGLREKVGSKSNPIIQSWIDELGFKGEDSTVPWCGLFMYHIFSSCGLECPKGPALSTNWLTVGSKLDAPAYGCVAVFTRKGGAGHVGIIVGAEGKYLLVLGGNQGDSVSIIKIPKERAVGYRWIGRYKKPHPSRYDL